MNTTHFSIETCRAAVLRTPPSSAFEALRRVMWVGLCLGEADKQQCVGGDGCCGPGEQAAEAVRAVAGEFHAVGDLAEGGLDPVAPFGDDLQQGRRHAGPLLLSGGTSTA